MLYNIVMDPKKSHTSKVMVGIMLAVGFLVVTFLALCSVTPHPIASISKYVFACRQCTVTKYYDDINQALDLSYGDAPLENLDILHPQTTNRRLPVIIWLHGGAFVGGDKSNLGDYTKILASNGYVVANVNYSLAPESHYPTPIHQLTEAYKYILGHASKYGIDPGQVIFGGDSAGAQIALQFVNIQTNPDYSRQLGIDPVVPPHTIKAAISLSGLLDFERFTKTNSATTNYAYYRDGWAYFNDRNWQTSPVAKQASVVGNTSSNFPPTFITDGNTNSFEDQARDLVRELANQHIPVTSKFYSQSNVRLGHQYQFDMAKPESQEVFDMLVDFLSRRTSADTQIRQ